MAKQTKAELDALIQKAELGPRAARKLHRANGTAEDSTPASKPAPAASRGQGAAAPVKPDLGEF